MDQIFNYLPFPFGNDLKRKYSQQDRPEIARARAAQAPNWCYVTISSSTDSVANYERLVREALRDRWDGRLKLKLIFDSPSNGEEKRAAAKIINVHIEEKMVEYAAQNQARGRGEAAEKAVVRFSDQTSRQGAPGSNWDRLPAIIVTNEAPEQLFFKFTNDKQEADFSGIARRQREALEQKLALALRTVPRFELLQSKGY